MRSQMNFKKILAIFLLAVFNLTFAAERFFDPGQRLLDDLQTQQKQKFEQERIPAIQVEVLPQIQKPTVEAVCFEIKKIILEDVTVFDHKQQQDWIKNYENRCLGKNNISRLIQIITTDYINAGYITSRAYLPPQNLKTGVLKIKVIEGKIQNIKLNQNDWRDRWRVFSAFPTKTGKVLRLQDIEQGLEQLRHIPSSTAEVKLAPGIQQGMTDIVLTDVLQDRFRGDIGYDNLGQPDTGEQRLKASLAVDNLFYLNDLWSLNYTGSYDTNALVGSVSVPFGYWTGTIWHSYSESLIPLSEDADLFSNSRTTSFQLQRLLKRAPTHKTAMSFILDLKRSDKTINDFGLTPQRLTVARLLLLHQHRLANSNINIDATLSQGLKQFNATETPDHPEADEPRAQFTKVEGSINYAQPFKNSVLSTQLHGQYSHVPLYSLEQFYLGGMSTVRGYVEGVVAGDSGWVFHNDWQFGLPEKIRTSKYAEYFSGLIPYVFLDSGQVFSQALDTHATLNGGGIGMRGGYKRLSFDVAFASPIDRKDYSRQYIYLDFDFKLF